jgi:asparagine synthase (glutamine-hydrolysing)
MCGINFIYAYGSATAPVDRAELLRTRDRMRLRGPDADGSWISGDGRVGFGHRRLSIIDVSPEADQPLFARDGDLSIVFNGEIYNHHELRAELERDGERLRTTSDTEVLLLMYARHGADMLPRLRGMFAFAIWQESARTLFIARDPYGIKPLYYSDEQAVFRGASQVKALLAGGAISQARDDAGIAGFYLRGSVPEPFTTYAAIKSLPAGTFMTVTERGASIPRAYFSIAHTLRDAVDMPRSYSARERDEVVREAVLESVRYHLVSDVPVGAFLSSGKDSTTIVALARELGEAELQTVTLRFEEYVGTPADEAPVAQLVADHYGTSHATQTLTRREFLAELPRAFEAMDQPTIDGLNSFFVCRAAAQRGLKVALSGTGGDELFGGYSTFRRVPNLVRSSKWVARVPGLAAGWRNVHQTFVPRNGRNSPKSAYAFQYGRTYEGAYLLKRGLYLPEELFTVMGVERAAAALERLDILGRIREVMTPDPGTPAARVAALESALFMRNQLLRDLDWASMAHSLEVRVPLVDAFLLQKVAPVVFGGPLTGKDVLVNAPRRQLPPEVVNRRKTGFTIPIKKWLAEEDVAHAKEFGMRGWSQFVLERSATT